MPIRKRGTKKRSTKENKSMREEPSAQFTPNDSEIALGIDSTSSDPEAVNQAEHEADEGPQQWGNKGS